MRFRCLALAFTLLACGGVAADTPTDPITALNVADQGAPLFQVFGTKEGLSDEIWSTIGFDDDGFVWAGSASTLARFDGYRWSLRDVEGARSLVRDMASDADGQLWAIFEREGLASYRDRRWQLAGQRAFFQRFSTMPAGAGRHALWVGTESGFLRLQDGRWVAEQGPGRDGFRMVIKAAQTRTLFGGPRQWLAIQSDQLWFRELDGQGRNGPWQRFDEPSFERSAFTDLVVSEEHGREALWVMTYGSGLYRLRDDGLRSWRSRTGELPSEAMYSGVTTQDRASGDRSLWIASRGGLLRIRGDELRVFDRRHGLPSNAVRGIKLQRSADGLDLLWLATEGGIVRSALTPSQWQTVALLGANENGVFGLLLEPDGRGGERLWAGTAKDGLALLEAGQWRYFNAENGRLPGSSIRNVWRLTGPDGKPWRLASVVGHPLQRIDDQQVAQPLDTPWPYRAEEAAMAALSRRVGERHELWFGTMHSGIYRLDADGWRPFPLADRQDWLVSGLAEQVDAQGRSQLWAAGGRGLARLVGDRFELHEDSKLPADGYRGLTLISENGRQVLWASTNRHGVVRVDVSDPTAPVTLDDADVPPAPDPTVYSVQVDSRGRIYVCTNNGVQQLRPLDGGGYAERVFRRRDGLVHDECNTNSQLVDRHDRYWVGTLGGLSLFDPSIDLATATSRRKPVHFVDLRADGRPLEHTPGVALPIPAGTRELRIDYVLLTGLHEEGSRYRSQLQGYEGAFGAWTAEHSRSFTGLPPGSYRLRVEAIDHAGTAGEPAALDFVITPLWWQQPLVRAGLVLLLIALSLAAMLVYNRGLRARQRALAAMVDSRTAELNAANQRLTELSYSDPLTGLGNRRRLMEVLSAALDRARAQRLPIGLIVLDVDRFKAYNDRHGHLAGDAALRAVARALESATREQDLVTRFGGEEFACLLLDATLDTVARIAERMRALVEALPPRALGNDSQTITLSAGILSRIPRPDDDASSLLHAADTALYRAKHEGRNRVCEAPEASGDPSHTPS